MSQDKIDLVPLVRQRLMWDMLPHDHEYWDVLELVPPSTDVAEISILESQKRMNKVAPYQKFVDVMSVLAADIITEIMFKNLADKDDTDVMDVQQHDVTQHQNREIVRGAFYPILAAMLDAGMLQPGMATL